MFRTWFSCYRWMNWIDSYSCRSGKLSLQCFARQTELWVDSLRLIQTSQFLFNSSTCTVSPTSPSCRITIIPWLFIQCDIKVYGWCAVVWQCARSSTSIILSCVNRLLGVYIGSCEYMVTEYGWVKLFSCALVNLMTRKDHSRGGRWCSVCFLSFMHYLAQLS